MSCTPNSSSFERIKRMAGPSSPPALALWRLLLNHTLFGEEREGVREQTARPRWTGGHGCARAARGGSSRLAGQARRLPDGHALRKIFLKILRWLRTRFRPDFARPPARSSPHHRRRFIISQHSLTAHTSGPAPAQSQPSPPGQRAAAWTPRCPSCDNQRACSRT